ncbi:hypothetical protein L6R52_12915 [Myxococcota bacterium]|nr:hypothetical protein [Myxococcota bacterium]
MSPRAICTLALLAACRSSLVLPGPRFFPESIGVSRTGALYVGSFTEGKIVRFAPGAVEPTLFIDAVAPAMGAAGVLVDDDRGLLFVCVVDPETVASIDNHLRAFTLSDGSLRAEYRFPSASSCNDLTLDGSGNLYVSDSVGRIFVLHAGAMQVMTWSEDPRLRPAVDGGYGADGIAWDGHRSLYVNTFDGGRLLRVGIREDGRADAVEELVVEPPLVRPDALRWLGGGRLVTVEEVGRVTELVVDGARAHVLPIAQGLDAPSSIVRVGGEYFVTEGQLDRLGRESAAPSLPFRVRRIHAR